MTTRWTYRYRLNWGGRQGKDYHCALRCPWDVYLYRRRQSGRSAGRSPNAGPPGRAAVSRRLGRLELLGAACSGQIRTQRVGFDGKPQFPGPERPPGPSSVRRTPVREKAGGNRTVSLTHFLAQRPAHPSGWHNRHEIFSTVHQRWPEYDGIGSRGLARP